VAAPSSTEMEGATAEATQGVVYCVSFLPELDKLSDEPRGVQRE
jgi:hypothetical protein